MVSLVIERERDACAYNSLSLTGQREPERERKKEIKRRRERERGREREKEGGRERENF
jgi:hypothetical protein